MGKRMGEYVAAREQLEHFFKVHQEKALHWIDAIRDLEKNYNTNCRPFHDTTMQCEKKWQDAMHAWVAREPLPQCLVGVVTPYEKKPLRGLMHWLVGSS